MGTEVDYTRKVSGTAVGCGVDGHCWHEGTAVGSLYCCRCGGYWELDPVLKSLFLHLNSIDLTITT